MGGRARVSVIAAALAVPAFSAQLSDTLAPSLDHPAIGYFNYLAHPLDDPITVLGKRTQKGAVQLRFEDRAGYLRSLLEALDVPLESQLAVFSKTSLQAPRIEPKNPRTIFFNDELAVAWVRGGFIEIASVDPEHGVIFYTLEQRPAAKPEFTRRDDCLQCHLSDASLGVPGMIIRSRFPAPDGMPRLILGGFETDHRSPFEERWGGWYVTGTAAGARHLGNAVVADEDHPELMASEKLLSLEGKFDTTAYLSPHSDIAALLVFNHQMRMTDLIIRFGWEVRARSQDRRGGLDALLRDGAKELVDYLLFDEAPRSRKGLERVCREIRGAGPAGQPETVASRPRSQNAAVAVSMQLHDLQPRVRRSSASGTGCDLPPRAAGALGRREGQKACEPDGSEPDGSGPPGDRGNFA